MSFDSLEALLFGLATLLLGASLFSGSSTFAADKPQTFTGGLAMPCAEPTT